MATTTGTTTTSHTSTTRMAIHTIDFMGKAGAICGILGISTFAYIIAFATTGWAVNGPYHIGLWHTCTEHGGNVPDWHRATQAMITIGLIGLIAAFVLICIYMCVHSVSKNSTIIALTIICFVSVLFMLIGFIIWGVKTSNQNFSFALAVIAAIMTLVAGVLSVLQMRDAGVRM